MPEKETAAFDGCKITSICFCPFITYAKTGYIVISTEIGGTPLYIQETTVKSHEWSNVKLDTPFEIKRGQSLYIGYRIKATGSDWPIGYYYSSNVMAQSMYIDPILDYVAYEKSDGTVMSGLLDTQTYTARRQTANLMLYATIEGELPQNSLSLDNMTLSKGDYIHTTDAQVLTTTITNTGTDSIKTFNLSIELDGVKKLDGTQNIAIAPLWERSFNMNIPAMNEGLHTLSVTIGTPNGKENTFTGTTSMRKEFLVYKDSVQKTVMIEHFTTAKCSNCVAGEEKIKEYIQNSNAKDSYVQVNHHAGFETDQLTTEEDKAYEWFYGTEKGGSMWAPANMIDRRDFTEYGAKGYGGKATTGPVHGTSGARTDSLINVAHRTPSFISLQVTPILKNGNNLSVNVKGSTLYVLPELAKKRLNVFLVEDSIVYPQKDADSVIINYVHNHVFRAALTGTWGKANVINNKQIDETFEFTIPEGWVAENMSVVAFISDYDSLDNTKCTVYQAKQEKLRTVEELPYILNETDIIDAFATNYYKYGVYGWMYMPKYGAWIYSLMSGITAFQGKGYLYTKKQIHLPAGTVYLQTTGTAVGDDNSYEVYIAEYGGSQMKDYATLVGNSGLLRNVINTETIDTTVTPLTIPEEGDYVVALRAMTATKMNQIAIATFQITQDTPDGIKDIQREAVADSHTYSISGQRVGNDFSGIIIKNGKKFVRK